MGNCNNELEQIFQNIGCVCNEVKHIHDKYDMLYSYTGKKFNIFSILGIEGREVYICRVICDLLSPNGSHGQKSLYLNLFYEHVLKFCNIEIATDELFTTATVIRESQTGNGRRIDIVLDTKHTVIGIEVKINAGDQNKQLEDYWKDIKNRAKTEDKSFYLLYLTKFGSKPSENSLGYLAESSVILISFEKDIMRWLNACLMHQRTIEMASVLEILKQLISTIKKISNQLEDDEEMEIETLLKSNHEYFKSMCRLANYNLITVMNKIKINISNEIFKGIEDIMQKNHYDCIRDGRHYEKRDDELLRNLSYEYKNNNSKISNKYSIIVSLEISLVTQKKYNKHKALIGYLFHDATKEIVKTNDVKKEFENEVAEFENLISKKLPDNYHDWAFLRATECNYVKDEAPDFSNWNNAYIELCTDSEARKEFIQKCAEKMIELIELH